MKRRSFLRAGAFGSIAAGPALSPAAAAAAPAVGVGVGPVVPLSSFEGATDDDKLTAFMSYAGAQTLAGTTVCLDELRTYVFTLKQTLYSGFSITGTPRPQDQARSSMPVGSRVVLTTPGGWFALGQPETFGCAFANLSLDGGSEQRLLDGHASHVLWTTVWRDISAQNLGGILGSPRAKLLTTACTVDGWWNVNNVRSAWAHLGGSDCHLSPSMFLLDSPAALLPDTGFLMRFDSQSKTHLSNFYITAEGHSALHIAGSGEGAIVITNCEIEGRNTRSPCHGALIRTSDMHVTIRDTWLAFAMSNPALTGRDDAGYVHAESGSVLLDGVTTARALGVDESVPILFASGGRHIVRNVRAQGYDGKPVVRQTVEGLIDADSSVTVRTGG